MANSKMANPFKRKVCVITGDLERYSRQEAFDIIHMLEGKTSDNPVDSMNFLILGRAIWSEMNNGIAPRKVQKAIQLREKGKKIEIISEDDFYAIVDTLLPTIPEEVLPSYLCSNVLIQQIVSLEIPLVGEDTARQLAECFTDLDELRSASRDELMGMPSIGYRKADTIYQFFRGGQ